MREEICGVTNAGTSLFAGVFHGAQVEAVGSVVLDLLARPRRPRRPVEPGVGAVPAGAPR